MERLIDDRDMEGPAENKQFISCSCTGASEIAVKTQDSKVKTKSDGYLPRALRLFFTQFH